MSNEVLINLSGDIELIRTLNRIGGATNELASLWLKKWALEIEKSAIKNLQSAVYDQPVRWHYIRTGFLKSGVTHVLEAMISGTQTAVIGVGLHVEYAKWVELMYPFLRPAFEEHVEDAVTDLNRLMRELIERSAR